MKPIYIEDPAKKRTFNEIIPNPGNEAFVFRIFSENSIHDFRHLHNELELIYIHSGKGVKNIGDISEEYLEGDVALIGSGIPHFYTIDPVEEGKNVEAWVIQFDPWFLGRQFYRFSECKGLGRLREAALTGVRFTDEVIRKSRGTWMKFPMASGLDRLICFFELLEILSAPGAYKPLISKTGPDDESVGRPARMMTMIRYLGDNYMNDIRAGDMAARMNLSKSAFCNLFKKSFNLTFSSYLAGLRLSHAARLLAETEHPVNEICYITGFNNQSYFNRCFKSTYRVNPREYRKRLDS